LTGQTTSGTEIIMTFMDKLKRKAEEYDLQRKADHLAAAAVKTAKEAKEKAAELADENRDKVGSVLDKAGAAIDQRTQGKYADKVAKAKVQVAKGVDRLADQRTVPGGRARPQDAPPAPPQDAPSSQTGSPVPPTPAPATPPAQPAPPVAPPSSSPVTPPP
jgi:hypothetical protein